MKRYMADGLLLFVTFVWGTTFVLVQDAVIVLPVFSFLALRFGLGGLLLLLITVFIKHSRPHFRSLRLFIHGIELGFWLFAGYALQTIGLLYTTPARSGFITGMSVVMVPVFSIWFLHQRPLPRMWWGVMMAALGLACLAISRTSGVGAGLSQHVGSGIGTGDILTFLGAICFAVQIVLLGKYASKFPPLPLSTIQILTVGALSLVMIPITHTNLEVSIHALQAPIVWIALLICACFATALAYLAQTVVQQFTSAAQAALIFSMEPVFAALTAYIWIGERLTLLEGLGCLLILGGTIVAEILAQHSPTKSSTA